MAGLDWARSRINLEARSKGSNRASRRRAIGLQGIAVSARRLHHRARRPNRISSTLFVQHDVNASNPFCLVRWP